MFLFATRMVAYITSSAGIWMMILIMLVVLLTLDCMDNPGIGRIMSMHSSMKPTKQSMFVSFLLYCPDDGKVNFRNRSARMLLKINVIKSMYLCFDIFH